MGKPNHLLFHLINYNCRGAAIIHWFPPAYGPAAMTLFTVPLVEKLIDFLACLP